MDRRSSRPEETPPRRRGGAGAWLVGALPAVAAVALVAIVIVVLVVLVAR